MRPDIVREAPGPDQESVWDYPRPPRLDVCSGLVEVRADGLVIARTTRALRVLETSHPPTVYLPPEDCDTGLLRAAEGGSFCEWKGSARYWDVVLPSRSIVAASWSYPEPTPAFDALRDHHAFYPALVECTIDGETVRPQPGGFYGGWITSRVVGPFKGAPGTGGW